MTCITRHIEIGQMIANESACGFLEVTLNDISINEDKIFVGLNSSIMFEPGFNDVINDGETKTYYDEGCKETWTVRCVGISAPIATIELCVTVPPPPTTYIAQ